MDLQLKTGNLRGTVLGTDVSGRSYGLVRGISAFLTEQAFLFQPAQLGDGIVQSSCIFFQVYRVLLGVPAGGGKIPGSILVEFDNRIIYIAKLALFMGIESGQRLWRISGKIIIINRIHDWSHCRASYLLNDN